MRIATDNRKGLTLLEVLVGVVIISIAAVVMLANSRSAATGQVRSKVYGNAATATREAEEVVSLMPLDSIDRLRETEMPHTQGPRIEVTATARPLTEADGEDLTTLETASLRHLTFRTTFESASGGRVTRVFTTVVYRP